MKGKKLTSVLLLVVLVVSTFAFLNFTIPAVSAQPLGVLNYVPITVNNTAGTSSVANFTAELYVNWSQYAQYINATPGVPQNVVFYNSTNTMLNAWEENYSASAGSLSVVWVEFPYAIPNKTAVTIYLGFFSNSTNFLNGTGQWGCAPQLTSPYSKYDNGRIVFPLFYDNFNGSSLNTTLWTAQQGSATISNNFSESSEVWITSISTFDPRNQTFDAYCVYTSSSSGQWGCTGFGTGNLGQPQIMLSTNPARLNVGNTSSNNNTNLGASYSNSSFSVVSLWIYNTTEAALALNYNSTPFFQGQYLNYTAGYDLTLGSSATTSPEYVQWCRMRYTAPANTMPTITFGSITTSVPISAANDTTNSTYAGHAAQFDSYWIDSESSNLSYWILGSNNTGTWVNQTATAFGAGVLNAWANSSAFTLNSTAGVVVQFEEWANDSAGSWGNTGLVNITVIAPEPQFGSITVNSTAPGSVALFSAIISDPYLVSGTIFSTNNTGTWVNDSWSAFPYQSSLQSTYKTLNSTYGNSISYEWFANDSSGNWNASGIQTISTAAFTITSLGSYKEVKPATLAGSNYVFVSNGWSGTSGNITVCSVNSTWGNPTVLGQAPFTGAQDFYVDTFPSVFPNQIVVHGEYYPTGAFIALYNVTSNTWTYNTTTLAQSDYYITSVNYDPVNNYFYMSTCIDGPWNNTFENCTVANLLNWQQWGVTACPSIPGQTVAEIRIAYFNNCIYVRQEASTGWSFDIYQYNISSGVFTMVLNDTSNTNSTSLADSSEINANNQGVGCAFAYQNGSSPYYAYYYSTNGISWTNYANISLIQPSGTDEIHGWVVPYDGYLYTFSTHDGNASSICEVFTTAGAYVTNFTGFDDHDACGGNGGLLPDGGSQLADSGNGLIAFGGEGGNTGAYAELQVMGAPATGTTEYYLTVGSDANGTMNATSGWYLGGSQIVIQDTPNSLFSFANFTEDSVNYSVNPITITMNANHTLSALNINYTLPSYSSISINSTTGGSYALISCFWNGTYLPSNVTFGWNSSTGGFNSESTALSSGWSNISLLLDTASYTLGYYWNCTDTQSNFNWTGIQTASITYSGGSGGSRGSGGGGGGGSGGSHNPPNNGTHNQPIGGSNSTNSTSPQNGSSSGGGGGGGGITLPTVNLNPTQQKVVVASISVSSIVFIVILLAVIGSRQVEKGKKTTSRSKSKPKSKGGRRR
jgi:hypothetical protein